MDMVDIHLKVEYFNQEKPLLFFGNCRRLNWDTVSQPLNDLFEPEIQPNLQKLPNFGLFTDSRTPKCIKSSYTANELNTVIVEVKMISLLEVMSIHKCSQIT